MEAVVTTLDQAIESYFDELRDLLTRLPVGEIAAVVRVLRRARETGQMVYICGNGGSASTASHFAVDLAKTALVPGQPGIRAIALTDNVELITAWGNDVSYDDVFAGQLANLVRPGDVVIAISGSGNSPNVLRAVALANERGAVTIGFSGFRGGRLNDLVHRGVVVPSDSMQQIEDVHLILNHVLVTCLKQACL